MSIPLPPPFHLDDTALQSAAVGDKGELFLLTWAEGVEKCLLCSFTGNGKDDQIQFSEETIRGIQPQLLAQFQSLITSSSVPSPTPTPRTGRALRAILARCVLLLFRYLGPTGLYDFVSSLMKGLDGPVLDTNRETKVATLSLLGDIMGEEKVGSEVRGMVSDIVAGSLRIFKTASYLGTGWTEGCYDDLVRHLVEELGCGQGAGLGWSNSSFHPGAKAAINMLLTPSNAQTARYDALVVRHQVALLLRQVVGVRLLSEMGQIAAIRDFASMYLSKYPALIAGEKAPSKQALILALQETAALIRQLGSTPPAVEDVLAEPLMRLQGHPSNSVQTYAAWTLRAFCTANPSRLSPTIVQLLELLSKDLSLISLPSPPADIARRTIGHARSLAALISLIPRKPLYVSFDVSAKCMSLAIQLLKQSADHELQISSTEIQAAWTVIGALMSLGSNFVRLHLPQLLILWKNALPKPTNKDASAAQVRREEEWLFLLAIREQALASVLSFLKHNAGLLNQDTSRRLVAILSNALAFANSLTSLKGADIADHLPSTSGTLKLVDRDLMYRRRLLQCFVALGRNASAETLHTTLLNTAISIFADPERYTGHNPVQAAIAAGSGAFVSVWDTTDGFGYGVTSLISEENIALGQEERKVSDHLNRDSIDARMDELMSRAVMGAAEHDPAILSWRQESGEEVDADEIFAPPPAATAVVDSALEVFAMYFPIQESTTQTALLQQLTNHLRSGKLEKNPGRKMAILVNAIVASLGALRFLTNSSKRSNDSLAATQVPILLRDFIKDGLMHSDHRLRNAASESMGRIAYLAGATFMNNQIQFLVNHVVSNTDPSGRAGCALAFGEMYKNVGGMGAGPVLKTIVDVLMSLSADPHPVVHFWALQSLSRVINGAGLSYSPFVNGTLGMVVKLYMSETHEPEGGSVSSVNMRGDLPAYQAFAKIVDALIGVLGPELQESERARDLVLTLLAEFSQETDECVVVESIRCMQHFLIFAPDSVDLPQLVQQLRTHLSSSRRPLKLAAVNSVYQLVQRNASLMSKFGGDRLVSDLFALLDDDPSIEGVRDAINSWLKQTADLNPCGWVDLCQRIMSKSAVSRQVVEAAAQDDDPFALNDEESQGLGTEGGVPMFARLTSRWRTQLFALQCLHQVFLTVQSSGKLQHFDPLVGRASRVNPKFLLVNRISDIIKMAFTASTAQVMDIRLEGLLVLRDVIENFQKSRDPDFEDALLLEQYQAPITSALTPAFAADSYPEVLSLAVEICGVFVGSGIVKEIDKMGRILKLLTNALENCKDPDMVSLGEVRNLSTTAVVMLKTSIFAAWAQFQAASIEQRYLVDVVSPHIATLCPFWVASLREYAKMRSDPDAGASDSSTGTGAFDSVHSGMTREAALPYYERAWLPILQAIATLMQANNKFIFAALDAQEATPTYSPNPSRDDPAAYFFVLYGLAYEVLAAPSLNQEPATTASVFKTAIFAIEGLVQPPIAGQSLFQDNIFEELLSLMLRLVMTESPAIQIRIANLMLRLAKSYSKVLNDITDVPPMNGSPEITVLTTSRMTQCLRVVTCILHQGVSLSGLARVKTQGESRLELLRTSFAVYTDIADLYPSAYKADLYAIAFHLYAELLKEEVADVDVAGQLLPTLKAICERCTQSKSVDQSAISLIIQGLLSTCIQSVDDVSGRQGVAVVLKRKNNMLALTLLLTSIPPTVKLSQGLIENCGFMLSQQAASDDAELSALAVHCIRSLVLAASTPNRPGLKYCLGQLLPGLIEVIAREAASPSMLDKTELRFSTLQDVLKTLMSFWSACPSEQRAKPLEILLPTFILLLEANEANQSSAVHQATISQLVAVVSQDPTAFKDATNSLESEQRNLLESALRKAMAGQEKVVAQPSANLAPKIELKSFG
ncbi:ARM repeat-containing protein [Atractiella rhizophila]|nr:ARM repeat-containing protein [Atractiella rhizophila]